MMLREKKGKQVIEREIKIKHGMDTAKHTETDCSLHTVKYIPCQKFHCQP